MAWFGLVKSGAKSDKTKKRKKTENLQTAKLEIDIDPVKPNDKGWYTIVDGNVWMKKNEHMISLIYSNVRLSDFHRDLYYAPAIRNFCRLVQALPASEFHHHSYAGGLIEHSLQVAKYALVYARKFMFSENNKEVELEEQFDVFAYCCFTAALMHDVGKIVTDFDIVVWNGELNPNGTRKPTTLLPINPYQSAVGAEYMWRYCSSRNKAAHESAAASLMQSVIPVEGLYWLRSCSTLWQQWFHTIAGRKKFGGYIAEVIEYCDSHSVEVSMQTNTSKDGMGTNKRHTLAERYVIAIRQLIESSALPLNRPGAAGFVSDDYLYLVSQRSIEAATPLVKNAGGTGIPKNVATVFSMLCDAGIALRHPITNDVIHTLHIRLNTGDGWEGELTFLKFPISEIDPNGVLGLVEADLEITDNTESKGFNAKHHKTSEAKNDADTDDNVDLATEMDQLTVNNLEVSPQSSPSSNDDILSALANLEKNNKTNLSNHKEQKKIVEDRKRNKKATDKINSSTETISNDISNKDDSSLASLDSDSLALDMSDFGEQPSSNVTDNSNDDSSLGSLDSDSLDLDMTDFGEQPSSNVTDNSNDDSSLASLDSDSLDLDMSDFGEQLSKESSTTNDDTGALDVIGLELDTNDLNDVINVEPQVVSPIEPKPKKKQKKKPKKQTSPIENDDIDKIVNGNFNVEIDPSNDTGLDQLTELEGNVSATTTTSPQTKIKEDSKLMEQLNAEDFAEKVEVAGEPTNYKTAIADMITWLDNGLTNRTIKFNKVTNKSNYVFNTKYGVFVCIYTLIDEYNKAYPNSTLKLKRIERILHELESQRLIHNSVNNHQMRVAHISTANEKTIALKGVYLKRDALSSMTKSTSYVDPNTCLIEP